MVKGRILIVLLLLTWCYFVVSPSATAQASDSKTQTKVIVDPDGTVQIPAQSMPQSVFLSSEAKAYVTQHLKDMQDSEIVKQDAGIPRFMKPYIASDYAQFSFVKNDTKIGGVHTYVYTPKEGVSAKNRSRVLINLHGGGFSGCWPGCAELESIPVAALGKIQVVSVDYRQGPDHKFPAASEDVASVYKELLKTYKSENIGIYGCSAGGMLTAMSVAWFQKHDLPRPAAIGIFCASAGGGFGGDASYTAAWLGEARMPFSAPPSTRRMGYFSDTDPKDPLVSPISSAEVASKFPPTLIITGTRGFEMSAAVHTHAELVKLGVETDLHVWEGLFHGFFYNMDVPESKDAMNVILKFFDRQLGAGDQKRVSSNQRKNPGHAE